MLEPRRLAARLAARRVADELHETLGQSVGYQVRFEEVGDSETRLWFVTEGVLTRKLLSDPWLRQAQVVVLDEFHERHLETDLALALLRKLQQPPAGVEVVDHVGDLERRRAFREAERRTAAARAGPHLSGDCSLPPDTAPRHWKHRRRRRSQSR